MKKRKIFAKLQNYLYEHKGISPLIFTYQTQLSNYGFADEEWVNICQGLENVFAFNPRCWPPQSSLTVGKWIDFIDYELRCRVLVKKWRGVYLTAVGEFWNYRYCQQDEIEVKKRCPDEENQFFELYRVEKDIYLIHKLNRKIINLCAESSLLVFWLDDFVCIVYPYRAEDTYLYNKNGCRLELNLPCGQIYKGNFEYCKSWLSFKIGERRFAFKLENNQAKPVSEQEFCENFRYFFEPSYGWREIDKAVIKQLLKTKF